MQTIVGIRFKKAGKIYYFNPGRLELQAGDAVVVETVRGVEYGKVVIGPRELDEKDLTQPLGVVQRKATEADTAKVELYRQKEKEAFDICAGKITEHKLPMKLVNVEYAFDFSKIVFYFTADGRIDFRELVKDLASVFRTRIELHQIGVRDEAKLMGGIGCCGRPLCCATFLGDFAPVSIRMAKDQNLSLNPTKISGICGRLMCCLKYENDCYCCGQQGVKKEKAAPPTQGSRVVTAEGEGKIISLNAQRRSATILLDDSKTIVIPWEDIAEQEENGSMADTPLEIPAQESVPPEREGKRPQEHHRERRKGGEKDGRRNGPEKPPRKEPRENRPRNREHRDSKRNHRKDGSQEGQRREQRQHASRENRQGGGSGKPSKKHDAGK